MPVQLVVKSPFAGYAVGAHITDPSLVAKFSASHPQFVIRKPLLESTASQPSVQPASPQSQTAPVLKPIS